MVRMLWELQVAGTRLSSFEGGNLRNAIPREAFAVVCIPEANVPRFLMIIEENEKIFKSEFAITDPGLSINAEESSLPLKVMDDEAQDRFIRLIYGVPHGVARMSAEMQGIVETSTNMSIVKAEHGTIQVNCLLRSSVDSAKLSLGNKTQSVMELAGLSVTHDGAYPGWKPNLSSAILKTMTEVYQRKFGRMPDVKVIHAGLECGIIGAVYPGMELISCGPTIKHPHSPDERVNIPSVKNFWEFLLETLENIPVKK
jgi:dipeptidase D